MHKMKRFDIYIGCNVNGKEKYNRSDVCSIVEQELANKGIDGCTFTEAIGKWKGENEATVICTVICSSRKQKDIYTIVGLIKDRLQQESILVMESEPKIAFI